MSALEEARSVANLLGTAVEQLGKLVQNEVQLAKAEIAQKLVQAGMGMAFLVGAAILLIPCFVLLMIALALWLNQTGLSLVTSHLIAAGVGLVVSMVLAIIGKSYLTPENLSPKVTLQQIERDVATAKELAK